MRQRRLEGASLRGLAALACSALALLQGGCGRSGGQRAGGAGAGTPAAPDPRSAGAGDAQSAAASSTLWHLVLDETVAAPPVPLRSPFFQAPQAGRDWTASGDLLRAVSASDEVAALVDARRAGRGFGGEDLLLVEWRIRWVSAAGPDEGGARFWGACALPCTLEDGFVAGPAQFPADVLDGAASLFALRPGALDLRARREGDGLAVVHGTEGLIDRTGLAPGAEVRGSAAQLISWLRADGVTEESATFAASRSLRVLAVRREDLTIRAPGPVAADVARVLPPLSAAPPAPRLRRAVEGIDEFHPWPDPDRLEGGFRVRPDPEDAGLRIERAESRVRWTPRAAQADQGVLRFTSYVLERGSTTVTLEPFRDGARVLAATPALDGRIRVAGPADRGSLYRAKELARSFARLASAHMAVFDALPREHPPIVYLAEWPRLLLPGGAGGAPWSFAVSSRTGETESVEAVFALLQDRAVRGLTWDAGDWDAWRSVGEETPAEGAPAKGAPATEAATPQQESPGE